MLLCLRPSGFHIVALEIPQRKAASRRLGGALFLLPFAVTKVLSAAGNHEMRFCDSGRGTRTHAYVPG